MNCPRCQNKMLVKKRGTSLDTKRKKKYTRVIYWCKKDDVWVGIEAPQITKASRKEKK